MGERLICFVLFTLLMVAVYSTVAIFYLTAMVYIPSVRELLSSFSSTALTCTTTLTSEVSCESAGWTSCWEWCLHGASGHCVQITASVRTHGQDLLFQDCDVIYDSTCPHLDPDTAVKMNCKDRMDYRCWNLLGTWDCDNGKCTDLTPLFKCNGDRRHSPALQCARQRNCVNLTGLVECSSGMCSALRQPTRCTRKCPDVVLGRANVVVVAGDRTVAATCAQAVRVTNGEILWKKSFGDHVVVTACVGLDAEDDSIEATDCVNATVLPDEWTSSNAKNSVSFSALRAYLSSDRAKWYSREKSFLLLEEVAFSDALLVAESAHLRINHAGCVNTLRGECEAFIRTHASDGRNESARDTFPCYYGQDEDGDGNFTDVVLANFDPSDTKHTLLLLSLLPSLLWVSSCAAIYLVNSCFEVDDNGRLNVKKRKTTSEAEVIQANAKSLPRVAKNKTRAVPV